MGGVTYAPERADEVTNGEPEAAHRPQPTLNRPTRRPITVLYAALLLTASMLAGSCGGGGGSDASSNNNGSGGSGAGGARGGRGSQRSATSATTTTTAAPTTTTPPPTLPDGTRTILPGHRVVAYYGAAGTSKLGILGATSPDQAVAKLAGQAASYRADGRPVLLALELIVTIASSAPTAEGDYSLRSQPPAVQEYLDAARRAGALLLLDIQPGRAPFLPEVQYYEQFLRQPDVGLAIDPEWSMGPEEIPGKKIGHTDAATINAVSQYLATLVDQGRLPQKLFVVHQFTPTMVQQPELVENRTQLAFTFHIDGFGGQPAKISKYHQLAHPAPFHNGFKLFYTQDSNLMNPDQVLGLFPQPDLITYQ